MLKIYNSLTGQKELFVPINKKLVGMYVCGPTVYNKIHIGNIRTFICFDIIYRYLMYKGYKVRYVRNITDVGHLQDNTDNKDKIIERAKIEKLEPMEIAHKYTLYLHKILDIFNNLPPNIEPTATGHINEQIEFIKKLINLDLAYEVNGSIYFNIDKYNKYGNKYGILSNKKLDELQHYSREIHKNDIKIKPYDFALWKLAPKEHIMKWNSPWGYGYPGWHLECTVMSTKYLGKTFDIHGGGIDLKFPHHECEIAQSKSLFSKNPVKYWIHCNMMTLNNKKMSKSSGNIILAEEILNGNNCYLDKQFSPNVLRFFILKTHYRSILNISNKSLITAEIEYNKIIKSINILDKILPSTKSSINFKEIVNSLYTAMDDDFNTPLVISILIQLSSIINSIFINKETISEEDKENLQININIIFNKILGIKYIHNDDSKIMNEDLIKLILKLRNEFRENKNWNMSDRIRDELKKLGIELNDNINTTSFNFKK